MEPPAPRVARHEYTIGVRARKNGVVRKGEVVDGHARWQGVLDAGVAFVQKPITPDALVRKVRQLFDWRQASLSTAP